MTIKLGSYGTILADPAWHFKTYSGGGTPHRTAVDHYPTMTRAQLERLPVGALAAPDCALFMWITDSNLAEGLALGRWWGFTFKTLVFVWEKCEPGGTPPISMGHWSRKQVECCYLFTRGKPKRRSASVRQLIQAPRREHSRKPDEQYPRIEALVDGPRLELFARTRRKRWASWGNQVDKFAAAD